MPDSVELICDESEVCREEAIFYLEGFRWDSDEAMKACRSQTLWMPSLTVEYSPRVNDSLGSSHAPPNPTGEQPPQSRKERIRSFKKVAPGTTEEAAVSYLKRCNWDPNLAYERFRKETRSTSSQSKLTIGSRSKLTIGRSDSQDHSTQVKIGSSSFSSMEADPTDSLNEAGKDHIPETIPLMASSQVKIQNIQESTSPSQIREEWKDVLIDRICDAAGVSRKEALFYLDGYKWKFDAAMEACRSNAGVPPDKESAETPPTSPEKLIHSFVEAVGATRQQAIKYLKSFKWDVDDAVGAFIEGFSEEETSAALSMSLIQNRDLPLSSTGLPSESQFQASYTSQNQSYLKEGKTGSSSSSISADPTETGNVTVAIPGISSSQVDEILKSDAYDQDSSTDSTVVFPVPTDFTVELEITLADGGSGSQVWIPLRPDETVRDIRNRIEEFRPADNIDYYLVSPTTGVEYRDLNTTVHTITTGPHGSTTLLQLFSS